MSKQFTAISWNCHRAKADSQVWDYLLELDPDIALLQEVGTIPVKVLDRFACYQQRAAWKNGALQRFSTVVLVDGQIGNSIILNGLTPWADAELEMFAGNLICRELTLKGGLVLKTISVYNPAWPIDPKRLEGIDISGVRLTQNPGLWLADILWASLHYHKLNPMDPWIIAGDFNLSETFDKLSWSGGGNREYLDRMAAIGLTECLRESKGAHTYISKHTWRSSQASNGSHVCNNSSCIPIDLMRYGFTEACFR
ncbi:MAG: endonuclease/exonuclease/phosphatase family protein [Anaerolineales bacterium]